MIQRNDIEFRKDTVQGSEETSINRKLMGKFTKYVLKCKIKTKNPEPINQKYFPSIAST